jgi:hypothetical protein
LFTRTGQALVTGGYHKARPYSVEAVFLYALCKHLQKDDPDADTLMIMGVSARLAVRMGYHRDPRHLAKFSPFESEMRRRTFSLLSTWTFYFLSKLDCRQLYMRKSMTPSLRETSLTTTLTRNAKLSRLLGRQLIPRQCCTAATRVD